ncbi:MAG: Tim44 domain-containing protein [Zoogloeaceae bacterium]|nr:Tim44 domain-containing protein [Rhodocyclaceae bacterium]MCP5237663.1 Tim44 domain-containing protein [Zoogloeaceae bacterium]
MKRFLVALFTVFVSFAMNVPDAEARRFGGGRSFGMQRDSGIYKKPTAPTTSPATPGKTTGATGQTPQKRSWLGPLAGLAAGLGIAALLSHLGLGEEFASIVMLALLIAAAFAVFRFFRARAQGTGNPGGLGYAGAGAGNSQRSMHREPAPGSAPAAAARTAQEEHEGFDAAGFERQAKLNFIRLQAASDTGNVEDIREFTTPEVFAEIAMQLRERGDQAQQTDVIDLDAEVLDVSEQGGSYIVSVRFSGTLREEQDAAPATFSEIWHLSKPAVGSDGWRIAGIQQG